MSGPKVILLSDYFTSCVFNTLAALNSIKIEFYPGKRLSKLNLCLLELSTGVFLSFVRNLSPSKKCNPGSIVHRQEMCLHPSLVFLLSFSLIKNFRSFGIFSHILIMPQVHYFSSFVGGLQKVVFTSIEL